MLKIVRNIFICILCFLLLAAFTACYQDKETQNELKRLQEYEDYLYLEHQSFSKTYAIIDKNNVEIDLPNYTNNRLEIYDKYGNNIVAFGIENQTVKHNWYTLQENNAGIIKIDFKAMVKPHPYNNPYQSDSTICEKTININLSPYNGIDLKRLNGEEISRHYGFQGNHFEYIETAVIVNATEFETTKIIDMSIVGNNHIYTVSYLKLVIDGEIVNIVEFIVTIQCYDFKDWRTTSVDEMDMLYEFGEIIT